jgi:uncharacterized membrane protein YkgB
VTQQNGSQSLWYLIGLVDVVVAILYVTGVVTQYFALESALSQS